MLEAQTCSAALVTSASRPRHIEAWSRVSARTCDMVRYSNDVTGPLPPPACPMYNSVLFFFLLVAMASCRGVSVVGEVRFVRRCLLIKRIIFFSVSTLSVEANNVAFSKLTNWVFVYTKELQMFSLGFVIHRSAKPEVNRNPTRD